MHFRELPKAAALPPFETAQWICSAECRPRAVLCLRLHQGLWVSESVEGGHGGPRIPWSLAYIAFLPPNREAGAFVCWSWLAPEDHGPWRNSICFKWHVPQVLLPPRPWEKPIINHPVGNGTHTTYLWWFGEWLVYDIVLPTLMVIKSD